MQLEEIYLLKPGQLSQWIFDLYDIWQMHFVSDNELGSIAQDRGLMSLSLGDYIKNLWQLGLLRADLVKSVDQINIPGLNLVGQTAENIYYYSDEREPIREEKGIGGTIALLPAFPSQLTLLFHPFRYYVLYHIDRVLSLNIHPLQMLLSVERYPDLLEIQLSEFQKWSASSNFSQLINRWNDIVSLAVAAEPHTYTKIFGILRHSAFSNAEEQRRLINQHWQEFKESLIKIGLEKIERVREDLCVDAERLDSNKDVHIILRLTEGENRLRTIKGRLGGAIYLETMAEMLRISAEEAFDTKLREEDELGFGISPIGVKEQLYGSNRLTDNNPSAKSEFLRRLGLDYGVRLRWYVEGDTEYHSIGQILGRYTLIDLINLKGNVVAKGGKGVAFRDNLRSDLRTGVFSFVLLDGDNDDYIRVVRKAAEDDEICGMFFISDPDFEFANFTLEELTNIIWELAVENGGTPDEKPQLIEAVAGIKSGEEFVKSAGQSVLALRNFGKGHIWGERLIKYAWNNQVIATLSDVKKTRPIVDAINFAISAVNANYRATKTYYRVDPLTGLPKKRNP